MTTSFGDIPRMVISHERENHIFNCHVYAMFCSSLHLACENIRPSSPVCSYARRGTAVFAGYFSSEGKNDVFTTAQCTYHFNLHGQRYDFVYLIGENLVYH